MMATSLYSDCKINVEASQIRDFLSMWQDRAQGKAFGSVGREAVLRGDPKRDCAAPRFRARVAGGDQRRGRDVPGLVDMPRKG